MGSRPPPVRGAPLPNTASESGEPAVWGVPPAPATGAAPLDQRPMGCTVRMGGSTGAGRTGSCSRAATRAGTAGCCCPLGCAGCLRGLLAPAQLPLAVAGGGVASLMRLGLPPPVPALEGARRLAAAASADANSAPAAMRAAGCPALPGAAVAARTALPMAAQLPPLSLLAVPPLPFRAAPTGATSADGTAVAQGPPAAARGVPSPAAAAAPASAPPPCAVPPPGAALVSTSPGCSFISWSGQSSGRYTGMRSAPAMPLGQISRTTKGPAMSSGGKLHLAVAPLICRFLRSYTTAASSAVSKVPSHSRAPVCGLRISAA